ncbi:hypothetical protein TNCV_4130161, partial [Trichonephila clavipes]
YTYGKPVQGTLNVNSSLERFDFHYSGGRTPVIHQSVKGDILRLKAFAYEVVRTGDVMHKHKFCARGTPKPAYMLLQISSVMVSL